MKKKQKSTTISAEDTAAAAAATTTTTTIDLKALIRDNRLFFDKLIDLIPPRFYLPKDDPDTWYRGLPKAAKASLKKQSRENLKLARRNRLDPEKKEQSSTLGLLEKSLQKKQKADAEDNSGEDHGEPMPINLEENDNPNNDNSSVTYEELRQKLRRRIEMLRGNRGDGQSSENNRVNQRKRSEKDASLAKSEGKKRKRSEEGEDDNGEDTSMEKDIEFGKVKLGDDYDKKKKKKVSKPKELERLKRLEEVKRENRTLADKEAWKAAANKAMGLKVYDNPKLLKESIKKDKRRKEKSSEKWKERMHTTEKMKNERQQKRRDNIAGKAKEKKMRKIAKREKKLMRPGFEGRKEGYITKDKS
ncbi:ribosomal RNA-processing protein 14-C-like [Solanum dulcamara]|uniref:ribosomal RNA-processing protein 14-C-like n=1 Tax=Solanum dulcamara TaxID=45834 RepID=UPI002485B576|nr:ribosomal RNA-processing protein 14-C-like [Solanum dulcamara]